MKTLSLLLTIIIFALLGMGFYMNDKIERLEASLINSDVIRVNNQYVTGKLNIDGYIDLFGDINCFGSFSNQDILIKDNTVIVGQNYNTNTTIRDDGIFFRSSDYNYLVKISAHGISLFNYSQGDGQYYLAKNTPWENFYVK